LKVIENLAIDVMKINKTKLINRRITAYTLQEILVVLVIIGILVMLALPSLMPLISKAKSTEAQLQLNHVYTLQKQYYYMYSKYSDNFEDIGFEHSKLTSDGGSANYQIEIIQADNLSFIATATAIADFDGDGTLNTWQIDQDKNLKEKLKD
jgi:type IV pilus assembly protein PilE